MILNTRGLVMDKLTDREWEAFFGLLDKIVDGPGSDEEKSHEIAEKAAKYDSISNLAEFIEWITPYGDDDEEDEDLEDEEEDEDFDTEDHDEDEEDDDKDKSVVLS